jgi:hypothetical protein
VIIDFTINGKVSAGITDRFRAAVAENNLQLQNVTCTLDVRRVNISKTGPANVPLTLPPMGNPVVVLIIIAVLGVASVLAGGTSRKGIEKRIGRNLLNTLPEIFPLFNKCF